MPIVNLGRAAGADDANLLNPFKHNPIIVRLAKWWLTSVSQGPERMIFTATTGRSGTMTLARLFTAVSDCVSVHEPWPSMCGPVLKAVSYGNTELVNEVYRRIKSVNILRASVGHRFYVEANHCFVKTFMNQAIAEFGDRVAVIHLVRPPIEVAMSIFRLNEEPGTDAGCSWWLDHRAPTNLIRIADLLDGSPEFSHPFYKALWYWHEVEARIAALRARLPQLKMFRFETQWMNDRAKVMSLMHEFGMQCETGRLDSLIGQKDNARDDQKTVAAVPNEQAQHMLSRFQELLVRRDLDSSFIHSATAVPFGSTIG